MLETTKPFIAAIASTLVLGCAEGDYRGLQSAPELAQNEDSFDGNAFIDGDDTHGDDDDHDDGSTGAGEPHASTMEPPPPEPDDGESTVSPEDDFGSTGTGDDGWHDTGSDEDDGSEPPKAPLWAQCDEPGVCHSETCLIAIEGSTQQPLSGYCTKPCSIAALDCPPPQTGNATPVCLLADEGEVLCGLDCTDGQSCPFGMQCIPVTEMVSYCF